MGIKKLAIVSLVLLLFVSVGCKKKETTRICKEGTYPRYENTLYVAHFDTNVFLSVKDGEELGADNFLVLYQVHTTEQGGIKKEERARVTDELKSVEIRFSKGDKYLMQATVEADKYNYNFQNICE